MRGARSAVRSPRATEASARGRWPTGRGAPHGAAGGAPAAGGDDTHRFGRQTAAGRPARQGQARVLRPRQLGSEDPAVSEPSVGQHGRTPSPLGVQTLQRSLVERYQQLDASAAAQKAAALAVKSTTKEGEDKRLALESRPLPAFNHAVMTLPISQGAAPLSQAGLPAQAWGAPPPASLLNTLIEDRELLKEANSLYDLLLLGEESPRLGEQKLDGGAGGLRARRQRAFFRYCFIARKLIGRANQRGHLAAAHDYSTSLDRVMEGEQERVP